MTAIAGVVKGDKVWIGGDSCGSNGYRLRIRSDEKVFKVGSFVMGFTTSFRMGQLLRFSFTPPDHDPRVDAFKYMVTSFVDAVRNCLKAGGFAEKEKEQESGGDFLVGYKGVLYEISSDYQVGMNADGVAAVGCGAQVALGALFANRDSEPESRIRTALEAAEHFTSDVRGPFTIISSE